VSGVTVLSIFYVLQCRRSSNKQIHGNGLHCKGLQRLETAFAGKQAGFYYYRGECSPFKARCQSTYKFIIIVGTRDNRKLTIGLQLRCIQIRNGITIVRWQNHLRINPNKILLICGIYLKTICFLFNVRTKSENLLWFFTIVSNWLCSKRIKVSKRCKYFIILI